MRIRGIGVIDDAVLELSAGLNVLTGETGAGKTMVVSGLGLLLGERADSGLVRAGADNGFVEGIVHLPEGHAALARAAEAGAEHEDGELVIARTISATGGSRAHVGGRTAPVGVLGDLGQLLVAVHGQADQWRLKQGDAHRELLDDFAGETLVALRKDAARLYDDWRSLAKEHGRLVALGRERARDIDSLTASLEQIEAIDPHPGEDVALRVEDERLAHADSLRLAAAEALADLSGDEYAAELRPAARDLIGSARSVLGSAARHDDRLRGLDERLEEVGVLVSEVAADLTGYLDDLEVDPARLTLVQERRAQLGVLTRRYGETIDEVLAWSQQAAARLDDLVTADDRVERLASQLDQVRAELAEAVLALSRERRAVAGDFAAAVSSELAHLAMGRSRVDVQVRHRRDPDGLELPDGEQVRLARHGIDDVEIRLAAGSGATPRSLVKAASGGELSRVMLALEVVGAGKEGPPTFVFDEIDAGVGGRAALDVGTRLAALAQRAQVIVVTHLAQVAAFADRHLVVHKADDGVVTASSVRAVTGTQRLRELSRMMGGDPDSEAGLSHARALLAQVGEARHPTDAHRPLPVGQGVADRKC